MAEDPNSAKTPLRRIIDLVGWPLVDLAAALNVDATSLNRAARRSTISEFFWRRIEDFVQREAARLPPGVAGKILKILEETGPLDERKFRLDAQQERPVELPEGDAWSFALQYRNAVMLDRLGAHAAAVGLTSFRMADGIRFEGEKHEPVSSWTDALYPCPQRIGLTSGMVVLLGDPENHPTAAEIFWAFQDFMRDYHCNLQVSIFPKKRNYVGYPTTLKALMIDGKMYQPTRSLQDAPKEPPALEYVDYGVIYSARRERLVKGPKPFGDTSRHVVFICGLHRAATGIGIAMLEDLDFRERVLDGCQFDFPCGDRIGVLAYRVRLRADNRGFVRSGSDWRHSRIEEIKVLMDWIQPVISERRPRHRQS
jgi:hypothetical protein